MHLTDHARMEDILFAYPRPHGNSTHMRILKQRPGARQEMRLTTTLRPLNTNDIVENGDIVEDIQAGERVPVESDTFYGFLRGVKAGQAKELPAVYDILREVVSR